MPRSALTHRDARGLLCDGCKLRFVDVGALKEHLGFPRAQLVNMTDPKLVERCPDRLPPFGTRRPQPATQPPLNAASIPVDPSPVAPLVSAEAPLGVRETRGVTLSRIGLDKEPQQVVTHAQGLPDAAPFPPCAETVRPMTQHQRFELMAELEANWHACRRQESRNAAFKSATGGGQVRPLRDAAAVDDGRFAAGPLPGGGKRVYTEERHETRVGGGAGVRAPVGKPTTVVQGAASVSAAAAPGGPPPARKTSAPKWGFAQPLRRGEPTSNQPRQPATRGGGSASSSFRDPMALGPATMGQRAASAGPPRQRTVCLSAGQVTPVYVSVRAPDP
jgi:hypothetical protein